MSNKIKGSQEKKMHRSGNYWILGMLIDLAVLIINKFKKRR